VEARTRSRDSSTFFAFRYLLEFGCEAGRWIESIALFSNFSFVRDFINLKGSFKGKRQSDRELRPPSDPGQRLFLGESKFRRYRNFNPSSCQEDIFNACTTARSFSDESPSST
jgi:hypothetical protein